MLSLAVPMLFYRLRGKLVAVPLIVGIFCTWREYENDPVLWAAAGGVFLAGLGVRIWAQQHLHFRLRMKMKLTTTGPYTLIRNPIYIGNTLICTGLTMASELLWLVPIMVLTCCIVYSLAVRHEEQKLSFLYGDEYISYMKRVPRWLPKRLVRSDLRWSPHYLSASLRAEAYNLLLVIPLILKELVQKGS